MTSFHRFVAPLTLLCTLPLPALAADGAAPAAGRNPAAAQALFEEAQQRVAVGDYEEACPKFKASYALDAAGGTLLNLADCLEKQGRTASAWSTFKDALVQAQRDGRNERVEYARQHIRTLEPKLAYLTVQVPAASNVKGLTLQVDGTELVSAAWGTALPVDPGSHLVRAEAPGFVPLEQNITLGTEPGAKQTLLVPALRAVTANQPGASAEDPMRDASEPHDTARTWAWITGGVGVAALGVGSYFGLRAYSLWDEREAGCEGGCTSDAKAAGDDAEQAATLATVSMSAGVALLATATVLFIVSGDDAPDAEPGVGTSLSLTPTDRGATLSWGGQF